MADRFGIEKSSFHNKRGSVSSALLEIIPKEITWQETHKKCFYCSQNTVIKPSCATILHIYLAFFIRIEGWCLPLIV